MTALALVPALTLVLATSATAGEALGEAPAPAPVPATVQVAETLQVPAPVPEPAPIPELAPVQKPEPTPPPPARPIYSLPTDKKEVVLTIDDGPGAYTAAILMILQEQQVPAAFFWIGGNNGLAQAADVIKQGHQVGSHTWSHPLLSKLDGAGQREQIAKAEQSIAKGAGAEIRFLRPPYGAFNPDTVSLAAELGQTLVLWNVDSRDWALADHPEQIVPAVMQQVKPGAIILIHERAQTVKVLSDLIKTLKEAGYSFRLLPVSS